MDNSNCFGKLFQMNVTKKTPTKKTEDTHVQSAKTFMISGILSPTKRRVPTASPKSERPDRTGIATIIPLDHVRENGTNQDGCTIKKIDRPCSFPIGQVKLTTNEKTAIQNYRHLRERQRQIKERQIREGRGQCQIAQKDPRDELRRTVHMDSMTPEEVNIIIGRRNFEKEIRGWKNHFK